MAIKSSGAKVNKKDMTTVYGTGMSKTMQQGKAYKVHKILAENLINKGFATAEKQEGDGKLPVKRSVKPEDKK